MSGTFNGTTPGNQPHLRLVWNTDRRDIAGNRTRIRTRLYLVSPYRTSFSTAKKGAIAGHGFTYTGGFNGTGTKLLRTQFLWINHNSSGVGSRSVSAYLDINISYSGSRMNRIHVSGTVRPDDIARKSDLTSASISGSLKENGTATLNLGINKKQSGFWHVISIRDGGTWITDWGYTQSSPSSYTIDKATVKKLLNRMRNTTSKSFTIRLSTYTRNGGGGIGSSERTVTASVSSTEEPTITSPKVSIAGSGFDSKNDLFIQGISKAKASFSRSIPYGAAVKEQFFQIENNKKSGTSVTSNTLQKSGKVGWRMEVTDTRGRSAVETGSIEIEAYRPPTITVFSAERKSSPQSEVTVKRNGSWSDLGGINKANITVEKKKKGGTWTSAATSKTGAVGGNLSASGTDTGINISTSYEYRINVRDEIGNGANRTVTISTAKVLLNFHEDQGVGIGKMHERGDLDLSGDIYMSNQSILSMDLDSGKYLTVKPGGDVALGIGADYRGDTSGAPLQIWHDGYVRSERGFNAWGGGIYRKDGTALINGGENSNGGWIRFADGWQICWRYMASTIHDLSTVGWRTKSEQSISIKVNTINLRFPANFAEEGPAITLGGNMPGVASETLQAHSVSSTNFKIDTSTLGSTDWFTAAYIAMGRWK